MSLEFVPRETEFPTVLVRGGFVANDLACVEHGYYAEMLTSRGEIVRARVVGRLGDEFVGVVERVERYDVAGARRLVVLASRSGDLHPGSTVHFHLDQAHAFIEASVCAARDRRQAANAPPVAARTRTSSAA